MYNRKMMISKLFGIKRYLQVLAFPLIAAAMWSCSADEDVPDSVFSDGEIGEITVSVAQLKFTAVVSLPELVSPPELAVRTLPS